LGWTGQIVNQTRDGSDGTDGKKICGEREGSLLERDGSDRRKWVVKKNTGCRAEKNV
jgi:hypothetical protein